jgi:hypothetical protein
MSFEEHIRKEHIKTYTDRVDCCAACRFGDTNNDEMPYYACKLHPVLKDNGRKKELYFPTVMPQGKCNHFHRRKASYKLGGASSLSLHGLKRGRSYKRM